MANLYIYGSVVGVVEEPDQIFVGGLVYYFIEAQIRGPLESFGYVFLDISFIELYLLP